MRIKVSKENIVNVVVLIGIIWFLLTFFKPDLILSKTITTGGDTASHYYTAQYMKEYLLPNLHITGWCPGNYAGFPILQFYFPLPFLLMVLMSYLIPLQISFKLVTILGTFLLPITAFFSFRLMKFRFPMPIIAAIFTLPFLFMEANSMWGGNIPSTLAGEFSYSLSLSLTVLFFGSLYRGVKARKHWVWNSLLLVLIALTHVYTLLFAVFSSVFLLLTSIRDKRELISRFTYMAETYLLSFLLISFWIVPMIAKLRFTTSYDLVWIIHHIEEVVPWILIPFIMLAILGVYKCIKDWDERIAFLYFSMLISAIFYLSARYLGVVDIRFIPFIQLYLMLCGAYGFSWVISGFRAKWIIPLIMIFLVVFWINNVRMIANESKEFAPYILRGNFTFIPRFIEKWDKRVIPRLMENRYNGYIPHWIKWNYEGFEGKSTWNRFTEINEFLSGTFNDPRVVYEHSQVHNSFGSSRAFESLPLFAGRSTLEGLYMQSSISAPFIFYIQSEISKEQSCPFYMNYPCTHYDLEKGTKHLKMFNVGQIISVSNKAKKALRNNKEYRLVKSVGNYEIYELTTNKNRYVVIPQYEPVLFKTDNWKQSSYDWFRNQSLISVPLVFVNKFDEDDVKKFKSRSENLSDIKKIPIDANCTISEEVSNEEIRIKTNCIGIPHLIRISYYPNWKVTGADKIYLVSPSFMLIFPEQEEVTLYYDKIFVDYLGIFLTSTGILILTIISYRTISRNQRLRRFLRR